MIRKPRRMNSKRRFCCSPPARRHRSVLQERCSMRRSSPMPWSSLKRASNHRAATRICMSCWQRPTGNLGIHVRHNEPRRKLRSYAQKKVPTNRAVDWTETSFVNQEKQLLILLRRYFVLAIVENFGENPSPHLLRLFDAVKMQDGGSNVIDACAQAHQTEVILDSRSHCKKRTRYIVTIGKIMLGDNRRGLLVVHVRVRIFLLELAQRLDAMVGEDEYVGVSVGMLQDRPEDLVESYVLVRKSIRPSVIDARIVADIVGSDGVQPMASSVFTGLHQKGEICRMISQQVIEELGLLLADDLNLI